MTYVLARDGTRIASILAYRNLQERRIGRCSVLQRKEFG